MDMFSKSKYDGIRDAINSGVVSNDDVFVNGMFRQTVGQTILKSSGAIGGAIGGAVGFGLAGISKLDGKFVVFGLKQDKLIIFVSSPTLFSSKYKTGNFFTVSKTDILSLEVIKKSKSLVVTIHFVDTKKPKVVDLKMIDKTQDISVAYDMFNRFWKESEE